MKRNIILLALLLLSVAATGQSPYFCTQLGYKSLRSCYDSRGKLTMYTQQTVTDVKTNGDITTVVVHTVTLTPDKEVFQYISPFDVTYEIRKGTVTLKIAANDKETENIGEISIPAEMKVGDEYGGGQFKIEANGIANKATIHYRKVVGEEKITTNAGTFHCMIFEQLSEMRVLGIKQKAIVKTWYAKNVGDVKSETYSTGGKLRSRTILEEFGK